MFLCLYLETRTGFRIEITKLKLEITALIKSFSKKRKAEVGEYFARIF